MVGLGVVFLQTGAPVLAGLGIALGVFLILGASPILRSFRHWRVATGVAWSRLIGLPRSAFGTAFAHMGLGVTVIGVVAVSIFSTETVVGMKPGDTVSAGGYDGPL
jgi:cytochrome c-type biogenesis protein CcmF